MGLRLTLLLPVAECDLVGRESAVIITPMRSGGLVGWVGGRSTGSGFLSGAKTSAAGDGRQSQSEDHV